MTIELDRTRWNLSRPRIGTHVEIRRHLVGSGVRIVIRDVRTDRRVVVGERELRAVRCMDGSRDVEGIAIAARLGADRVGEFVCQLGELGLLDPGGEAPEPSFARDLPVRALPGYGWDCDGSGTCCELFESVLFTPFEVACARAAAPDILDAGHDATLAFSPAQGLDETLLAVAVRDGACAYLGADRRCRIYGVRPHGCRGFPMRYVDVGSEIRVAPRAECGCVFEPGSGPITDAKRGSELPRETYVERPEGLDLGPTDALVIPEASLAEWCAEQAGGAAPIDWDAIRAGVERLRRESAWRLETDLTRQGFDWVATALGREDERESAADEALFIRAAVYLGDLAFPDRSAVLRGWEARIRIARRIPDEAIGRVRSPLGLVNALARGQGLRMAPPIGDERSGTGTRSLTCRDYC